MKQKIKVRLYNILADRIEKHISVGYSRSYKYTEGPTRQDIERCIYEEIMLGLKEIIDFDV